MIRAIRIRGLGPHVDTTLDLDPRGVTEIEGRSEAGKTTILDAITFALWGQNRAGRPLHLSQVHDDATELEVELVLSNGATIERALRTNAKGERVTVRKLRGQEYTLEREWTAAMKGLGEHSETLRQILVPQAWTDLTGAPGNGRRLRNLLAGLLGVDDIEGTVRDLLAEVGHEWAKGDALHPHDAEDQRRRARKARDEAQGVVTAYAAAVSKLESEPVASPGDAEVARGIVEAARAWEAHDRALDLWTEHEERRGRALEDLEGWRARVEALGPEPSGDAVEEARRLEQEYTAARNRIEAARRAKREAFEWRDRALSDLARAEDDDRWHPPIRLTEKRNAARRELQEAQSGDGPASCPACQLCHEHARGTDAAVAEARKRIEQADAAYDEAEARLQTERAQLAEQARAEVEAATDAIAEAERKLTQAETDLAVLRERRAESGGDPVANWRNRRAQIGREPEVPAERPRPAEPDAPRPPEEDVEQARAELAEADRAAGAAEQRAKDLRQAKTELAEARKVYVAAESEAERCDSLVDAVRRAPTVIAQRRADAFGDLGPVELVWEGEGVEVLVDGRPWDLASDGRLVVADAYLRAGIRRLLGIRSWPIVIDRAQAVAGQPLPTPAPAIVLVTRDRELGVVREVARV